MYEIFSFLKVFFFTSIIYTQSNMASAEYQIKDGETGKYRWYDEGSKLYRPCCYCPKEAKQFDRYIKAFQVPNDYKDSCSGSSETYVINNQNVSKSPYCFCDEKMGLRSEFIGCTLPNRTDVLWTCDNSFLFPNISVYTICKPQCRDDKKIASPNGNKYFRCNELKMWEQDPGDVHCEYEDQADDNSLIVIIVVAVCSLSALVVLILCIYCYINKKSCFIISDSKTEDQNSSETPFSCDGSNTVETCLSYPRSLNGSDTSRLSQDQTDKMDENRPKRNSQENGGCTSFSQISELVLREKIRQSESVQTAGMDETKQEEATEEDQLLPERNDDLVCVKCCAGNLDKHVQDGKTYYSVLSGSNVVIATNPVAEPTDFSINRSYDNKEMNYFMINNVTSANGGKYEWSVKDRGKKKTFTGVFFLNIEEDRKAPQGESFPPLPKMDSVRTVEEDSLHFGRAVSYDDEATVVCNRIKDFSSHSRISTGSGDISSGPPMHDADIAKRQVECCSLLLQYIDDPNCSENLEKICNMLDPITENTAKCWKGFTMFYKDELKIEQSKIESIKYHKKGDPEDGHMQYVLHKILPQHGFKIGQLVYYFSLENSFREDVLKEIRKFHRKCQFCDKYLQYLEKFSDK